jgi:hypothetical protein
LTVTLPERSIGRYNIFGQISLGGSIMTSFILAVALSSQVVDLPFKRGGSSCANGQCGVAQPVETKQEKPVVKPVEVQEEKVFRGGKLRFKLRGSSCCG